MDDFDYGIKFVLKHIHPHFILILLKYPRYFVLKLLLNRLSSLNPTR